MSVGYLIIAGTEKSGTTSVYHYLNAHPQVIGSCRKETDYFRSPPPHDLGIYESLFPPVPPGLACMEASPGYLAEGDMVAPAIASLIPDAKILFILRDPVERILSSYQFHKSRYLIPQALMFDQYIDLCFRFDRGEITPDEAGLGDWFLRVLDAGRYAAHLRDYQACFAPDQIKVLTLDRLKRNAREFMREICEWAKLEDNFYDDFDFVQANVTFSPRYAWLQRLGLWVNDVLEPFFNRRPELKQRLLFMYKWVNSQRGEKPSVSDATIELLRDYYARDVGELIASFGEDVAEAGSWLERYSGFSAAAAECRPPMAR